MKSNTKNQHALNPVHQEEIAAIGKALHLYLHTCKDNESEVITFNMPPVRYSPWALKSLVMKRVVKT
jgi:hypothetical protein